MMSQSVLVSQSVPIFSLKDSLNFELIKRYMGRYLMQKVGQIGTHWDTRRIYATN